MKRFFLVLVFVLLVSSLLTAADPLPDPEITVLQGLPATMEVGKTYTVIVQVTDDQAEFLLAQALPSFAYPGKGVVALKGGDHAGRGTSAVLEITFQAKSSTAKMPGGVAPVYVVAGVRYPGGYVVTQPFLYEVAVP